MPHTLTRFVWSHRSFVAGAVAILASSVGLNVVVFSFVNALWLRPLPFARPDRLVTIVERTYGGFDTHLFDGFEAVAGQVATDAMDARPEIQIGSAHGSVEAIAVTSNYFRVLGLPIRGRDFTVDDDRPGAEPVAIVSEQMWSGVFARRPEVIGLVIDSEPVRLRIIGVAPRGFRGARRGEQADLWIPEALLPRTLSVEIGSSSAPLLALIRLAPGDSVSSVNRRLSQNSSGGVGVVPIESVYGTPDAKTIVIDEGRSIILVGWLAAFVLIGGCAALAALVLVHFERRRQELAVRVALGASRIDLIRRLALELSALAVGGAAGSWVLAWVGLKGIPALTLPGGVNLARLDISLDWRAMCFALGTTIATLLLAAIVPITRFTRAKLTGDLLGLTSTASRGSQRLRQGLLGFLVCATVVVLTAAGLFIRAVSRGLGDASGIDIDETMFVTAHVAPSLMWPGEMTKDVISARTVQVRDGLRAIPGIKSVAEGMAPIDAAAERLLRQPVTLTVGNQQRRLFVAKLQGSPELLSTLGVPLLAGRALRPADALANPIPAVMTQSLVDRCFGGHDPLGTLVSADAWRGGQLIVVGVARDFAFGSLTRPADGTFVVATREHPFGSAPRFVMRLKRPGALAPKDVQPALLGVLPGVLRTSVATGRDVLARDLGEQRLGAWLFSGFGIVALLVGVGSVFGLVAYLAESRRREYAVRLALGASPSALLQHGMAAAMQPVLIGLFVGIPLAMAVSRLFSALLVGLRVWDPATYAGVGATILCAAFTAALAAAWRLRRVVAAEALRTI